MCPGDVASKEKQDLYAIHGLNPGEYDDIIPASWLCCPPTRLDADDVEMDALRVSRLLPVSARHCLMKTVSIPTSRSLFSESQQGVESG